MGNSRLGVSVSPPILPLPLLSISAAHPGKERVRTVTATGAFSSLCGIRYWRLLGGRSLAETSCLPC